MSKLEKKHGRADKATFKLNAFDALRVEWALQDAIASERRWAYLTLGAPTSELKCLEDLLFYFHVVSKTYWK